MVPHELLGTVPGWISAGGIVTLIGLVLRFRLGSRKLDLDQAAQHDINEQSIRDHYAKEVERLTDKLEKQSKAFRLDLQELEDRYRKMLDESEKRHDDCILDRDKLRDRVYELENEWRGLIRMITQASIDKVLMIPGELPDDIKKAAERVELIIRDKGRE